ncbi:hypothetical protein [Providencia sp. Me31A]|uniref:hypothetical protein n=1 Tax=Providencia sp. Me31A TaxID=3392637 RepID=UPI003D2C46E1
MKSMNVSNNNPPQLQRNIFAQEPQPRSIWTSIKCLVNNLLSHPFLTRKPKVHIRENPIYSSNRLGVPSYNPPLLIDRNDNPSNKSALSPKTINCPKSISQIDTDKIKIHAPFTENQHAINAQVDISDDERKMHHQLNELDKAIRQHPQFKKTEGIFRLSGKKADANFILSHLDLKKPLTQDFINKNNISLPSMTLAYKVLFEQIMNKQNYFAYFLDKSPDKDLAEARQNQQDVIAFMKKNGITGEKEKNILAKTNARIYRETPTLPFNMLISLFADITKNPTANMDANNLATCIAPRLLGEKFETLSLSSSSSSSSPIKIPILHDRMIPFVEALIHSKLHS